jgi:hypothetical protein
MSRHTALKLNAKSMTELIVVQNWGIHVRLEYFIFTEHNCFYPLFTSLYDALKMLKYNFDIPIAYDMLFNFFYKSY